VTPEQALVEFLGQLGVSTDSNRNRSSSPPSPPKGAVILLQEALALLLPLAEAELVRLYERHCEVDDESNLPDRDTLDPEAEVEVLAYEAAVKKGREAQGRAAGV